MEYLRARVCEDYDSPDLAVLVTGFRGEKTQLAGAELALRRDGYNTVTYSYIDDVFTAGDPELLPSAIDEFLNDVEGRLNPAFSLDGSMCNSSGGYEYVLPVGVSAGALFALELQRKMRQARTSYSVPGIYAAAGADTAWSIFHNPIMRSARKAFLQHHIIEHDLAERWKEFHEPPQDGFVVALGMFDHIVQYRKMQQRIAEWRASGVPILQRVILGTHTGTIQWFDKHTTDMIKMHNRLVDMKNQYPEF